MQLRQFFVQHHESYNKPICWVQTKCKNSKVVFAFNLANNEQITQPLMRMMMVVMMMIMMMMMMMNSFCDMADRRKVNLICNQDDCQRSWPLRISDASREEFEHVQNLSSGLVKWSCALVIAVVINGYVQDRHKNIGHEKFQLKKIFIFSHFFTIKIPNLI